MPVHQNGWNLIDSSDPRSPASAEIWSALPDKVLFTVEHTLNFFAVPYGGYLRNTAPGRNAPKNKNGLKVLMQQVFLVYWRTCSYNGIQATQVQLE